MTELATGYWPLATVSMYIELHARSAFSFLEGASVPEELAEICAQYQMPAMALLDRDGVYGAPRFHLAAQKLKVKAHIGAEITSLLARTPAGELPRLPLLCTSREGYQNLCRLITRMKLRAPKYPASLPQRETSDEKQLIQVQATALPADLAEHAAGLICHYRGRRRPAGSCAGKRRYGKQPAALWKQLIAIYGRENVYVELQRHYSRAQEARNQAAIELARSLHLPLLATQGAALCQAGGAPDSRRLHLHPQSSHARYRRTPAGAQ